MICLFIILRVYMFIRNTSGSTPLHFAAGNGHSFIVEYLLENPLVNSVSYLLHVRYRM